MKNSIISGSQVNKNNSAIDITILFLSLSKLQRKTNTQSTKRVVMWELFCTACESVK